MWIDCIHVLGIMQDSFKTQPIQSKHVGVDVVHVLLVGRCTTLPYKPLWRCWLHYYIYCRIVRTTNLKNQGAQSVMAGITMPKFASHHNLNFLKDNGKDLFLETTGSLLMAVASQSAFSSFLSLRSISALTFEMTSFIACNLAIVSQLQSAFIWSIHIVRLWFVITRSTNWGDQKKIGPPRQGEPCHWLYAWSLSSIGWILFVQYKCTTGNTILQRR